MALSDEDVQALGKLLDQRLEAHGKLIDQKLDERDRRARGRRRFWLWFWILVFVLSSVASWWAARGLIGRFQDQITQLENETIETKIAYQRQLATDRQMQRERAEAEKATGYRSEKSQADFDADLLRQTFQLLGKSADLQAKQKQPGASTDDDLEQQLQDVGDMTAQMSKMLGQLMLHETDPAHDTRTERLAAGGEVAPQAPAVQADPSPAQPQPAPAKK